MNTSDDLDAVDGELKASRQVISLLQRQLELFRVEKEGLEKLIISQSNYKHKNDVDSNQFLIVNSSECLDQEHSESQASDIINNDDSQLSDKKDNGPLGETQKMLLGLIQEQLYAKDEEIVKLKFTLKETQNDKEQLALQVHLLEEDTTKLKSENLILNENLALRDQTIVSLSNEVFEQSGVNVVADLKQSNNSRRQSLFIGGDAASNTNQQSLFKAQRQIAKLIDTVDAYKKTNELLSNNVMSLTERCTEAEKKEIETRSQCQELEAKCCQIQSKLLSLLKEIEQSTKQQQENSKEEGTVKKTCADVICSESVTLLIKRLLEDKSLDIPLSWKEGNSKSTRDNFKDDKSGNKLRLNKCECDELGFYIETYDDQLVTTTTTTSGSNQTSPNKRSSNLIDSASSSSRFNLPTLDESIEANEQNSFSEDNVSRERRNTIGRHLSVDSSKSDESRWHLKWDYFIKDFDCIDIYKSKEFKSLLRSGVPQEYRCKIWKTLINMHIGKDRTNYGPDYYQGLLQPKPLSSANSSSIKKPTQLNPSYKQIELDLLRTLPNNRHFENLDSSGTVRLRRVLTAYSEHNPKVGYCQGMNRLAAVALLVLPEEEAFWCLTTIVEKIMPPGYYNDLWLAQVDSSVVMDFVASKMPNLSDHFRRCNVDLSLFAWFLTIFVDGTPPALFLRLWDSFLYEGDKILFRVALALLKMYESHLLRLDNSVSINNYLRSTVNEPMNIDQFFEIAFEWINPLSSRTLKNKRMHHLQLIKTGFENMNRSFASPSPTNSDDDKNSKNYESPHEDSSIISV